MLYTTMTIAIAVSISISLAVGLGTTEPEPIDHDQLERNGVSLSGARLNGLDIPGPMTVISGSLGDEPLVGIGVQGADFVARMEVDGEMVQLVGGQLLDARMVLSVAVTSATGTVSARKVVADIVDLEGLEGSGLTAYHLLMYDADTISWVDPCPNNDGQGLIPLRGGWDPSTGAVLGGETLTFACRGDVLAKCVEWGYQPWHSEGDAMLHQACTRMARADYCGDGTAMTVDGTKIDVYDAVGIQDPATHWPVEAEWGPDGATCLGGDVLRMHQLGIDEPDCQVALEILPECGTLSGDSLLANRYDD